MACLPIDYICSGDMGDTKESVWKVLKWSFDAMFSGKWPKVDWNNNAWTDAKHHRHRKNKAGQWLTGDSKLRAVVVKLKADLKHFGDTYNIPYKYNTATPCWLCKCTKTKNTRIFLIFLQRRKSKDFCVLIFFVPGIVACST